MNNGYSLSLRVLYDQAEPVGRLGRGAAAEERSAFHDVAVIWDEDHDVRVLAVLEAIYLEGLLPPILFLGERKGVLYVVLSDRATAEFGSSEAYRRRLLECARIDDDVWSVEISSQADMDSQIIAADANSVRVYLEGIDLLWDLGTKPARSNRSGNGREAER